MIAKEKPEGMLSLYRVLDLADEKGFFCGKLMGDLGADVIKIEKPGGDPSRNIGPFYHDEPDPEKSLLWWAFNTSKRGITLDIETTDGKETFKKLVKSADFVIESFPAGHMDKLGLGYSALESLNPGIIMVSITPFGQTGPYKDYKTSDIVSWALGGYMYLWGDTDRPPVRISHHSQAYLHASGEAAIGAMIALTHRQLTGCGQHVDVSIQAAVARFSYRSVLTWNVQKTIQHRGGGLIYYRPDVRVTSVWPCKDGYVLWTYPGGARTNQSKTLVGWMDDEGMADAYIKDFDWSKFDQNSATQEVLDHLAEPTHKFFMTHTKAELLEGAVQHRITLFPVSTTSDLVDSIQLSARGYWVELEHPELGTTITYPGAFARTTEAPPRVSRRAPHIGEHNQEILGTSGKRIIALKPAKNYPTNLSKQTIMENLKKKPLDGIRVADFTWFVAGPTATKNLASWGAEVIRIEGRNRADGQRTLPPFKDNIRGENRSAAFALFNSGKLSVALNLANPKGVDIARLIIARSDIVIESFAGGVMEKMGLGYEEIKKVKPDIIMLSSSMMGQTGPHASHPGFGSQLTALAGFSQILGWPDREPPDFGVHTDFIAPLFTTPIILAALDYRRRTGKGMYLDLSQFENSIHFLSPLILDYIVNRRIAGRIGNSYAYAAPHGAYRCHGEDRWCAISVFTDMEWQSFCMIIGNLGWTRDPRFATIQSRKENEEELNRLIEEWTINHSPEEVMTTMQAAGIAAGVLQNGVDLWEHEPQLKHRHFYRELEHPEIGKYFTVGPAYILSKSSSELRRAPLLGEHNEHILKGLLGMTDEDIAQLLIEGIVE
jgi:crotonobetainyl-CoA:carnitine CoA-transferase CaiB-like acyl-CoA transferase